MRNLRVSNKTIWTVWYQGLKQSPPLVQICIQSWRQFNPDWEVIVLDRDSLTDWIAPTRSSTIEAISLCRSYQTLHASACSVATVACGSTQQFSVCVPWSIGLMTITVLAFLRSAIRRATA